MPSLGSIKERYELDRIGICRRLGTLCFSVVLLGCFGCGTQGPQSSPKAGRSSAQSPAAVDAARIIAADKEPGNWLSYGRTYSEQRFSPLKQITDQNVNQL